jgi:hypothetical protein
MDAYLRRLQREASQGDPEDIRRYIAALERVIGQDPRQLRRLLRRSMYALQPFAELEHEVDGSDAPWYLDENYILRAHDIHGELKEFFEDDD